MNDSDLRARFQELREAEGRGVSPFRAAPASGRSPSPETGRRPALHAVAVLLLLVVILIGVATRRPRPQTSFSPADTRAARAISAWRAPTDSLLHPPGSEVLTSLPSIPSKGLSP